MVHCVNIGQMPFSDIYLLCRYSLLRAFVTASIESPCFRPWCVLASASTFGMKDVSCQFVLPSSMFIFVLRSSVGGLSRLSESREGDNNERKRLNDQDAIFKRKSTIPSL